MGHVDAAGGATDAQELIAKQMTIWAKDFMFITFNRKDRLAA
jgi:hypothetical protein